MKAITRWYLLGIFGALTLLGVAYFYFQLYLELVPCPLCMFQRAALVGVIAFCLFALLHRPAALGQRIYCILIAFSSAIGAGIAGRQVWLQHLPAEEVPVCGMDPIYRWAESVGEDFSFIDMISTTLKGSGDCAEISWMFFGLSIGGWMLVVFSLMCALSLLLCIKAPTQ